MKKEAKKMERPKWPEYEKKYKNTSIQVAGEKYHFALEEWGDQLEKERDGLKYEKEQMRLEGLGFLKDVKRWKNEAEAFENLVTKNDEELRALKDTIKELPDINNTIYDVTINNDRWKHFAIDCNIAIRKLQLQTK